MFEISNEGFIHHIAHNFTRGIEGSCVFPGGSFGFGIVASQKILKHFPQELRVEGYFFLDRCVLGDGKLVAVQDVDQPFGGVFLVFGIVGLVIFIIVHWLCDLLWLSFVSVTVYKTHSLWGLRFQEWVFIVYSLVLIGFGIWFVVSGIRSVF